MCAAVTNLIRAVVETAKPNLATFVKFAKVELVPPMPGEIGSVVRGMKNLAQGANIGRWKQLTVREAWLNTLVATEVICWFFVGECIGKRNFIGYKITV